MSKLDLSSFRKVDANKTHTIMRSPEGVELHIPHASISKTHVNALRKLPLDRKMAKTVPAKQVVEAPAPPAKGYYEGEYIEGEDTEPTRVVSEQSSLPAAESQIANKDDVFEPPKPRSPTDPRASSQRPNGTATESG